MGVSFSLLPSCSAIGFQGSTRRYKMRYNFPIPDIDVSYLSASPNQVILNVFFKNVAHLVKMLRKLADVNISFTFRLMEYSVKLLSVTVTVDRLGAPMSQRNIPTNIFQKCP